MCTVTWLHHAGGFDLLCNRDEKHTRLAAVGPRIAVDRGIRYIAPIDGDRGGTWLSVNEFGVAVCLLNGDSRPATARESRGHVVTALAGSSSVEELVRRAGELQLGAFAAFTVAAISADDSAVLDWNGVTLALDDHPEQRVPLISSSFDVAAVRARRRAEFDRLFRDPTLQSLQRFHTSHGTERGPYSTCMHRDDARTVSFSWVKVFESTVEFRYVPDSPCRGATAIHQRLERRA